MQIIPAAIAVVRDVKGLMDVADQMDQEPDALRLSS